MTETWRKSAWFDEHLLSKDRSQSNTCNGAARTRGPAQWGHWFAVWLFLSLILASAFSATTAARADQDNGDSDLAVGVTTSGGAIVGIDGHYRVGRQTAIRLDPDGLAEADANQTTRQDLTLETTDGDGVVVRYSAYPPFQDSLRDPREIGYVVPGSEAAPLNIVRRNDQEPTAIVRTRFPVSGIPDRGPSMIPPEMPWVVVIGDPLGVDEIGASNVLVNKTARIAVTKVGSAASLPFQSLGYDGVDMVMVNATGLPVLSEMSDEQTEALSGWLRQGGRVFVCLGESAEEMAETAPWLLDCLPIDQVSVSRYDPAELENYTSSLAPLDIFRGIKLPKRLGRPLLSGRTTRRISAVLAAEYAIGFGQVTVIAADLDRPEFTEWPERLELVTRLVGELFAEPPDDREGRDGSTSFNDLSGQMRGVLDQFAIKPSFSFSLVSVILMVLIAAVGPLDYLLINRFFGKPLLGWLSFPLIVIGLSVFLVIQASPRVGRSENERNDLAAASSNGSSLMRANQFQIVDVDLVDGTGRGFAWSYLYSHEPAEVDVSYSATKLLAEIGLPSGRLQSTLFPMGYPGRVFGGIQLAGENTVLSAYSVTTTMNGKSIPEPGGAQITGLTIAPRSSKSIATELSFIPKVDGDVSVTRRPGSELLRGQFNNPLPMDILDGVLISGNWVYLLPTRLPAGSSVPQLSDLRQKNFRWRLTRQQAFDDSVAETTPWSPSDFADGNRVAEMLMFHQAAGGELYTGLRHDALGKLDLSELLVDDRCILVGRTEKPLFELEVRKNENESGEPIEPDGEVLSIVRVVLPLRSTLLN